MTMSPFHLTLEGKRIHAASDCPCCASFAWDTSTMSPAFDMVSGTWHHPSCKRVPRARAQQRVARALSPRRRSPAPSRESRALRA
jgi:hypothetical protein